MTATRLTGAVGALPDGVLTPSQPAGPYGDGTALSVDEEGLGGTSKARAVYSEAVAVAPLIKPEHGRVYTRRWVVEALLDLAGYTADRDLAEVALVEPSVGEGAFLIPVLERLLASVRAHGRSPADLGSALTCFDIHPENVERSRLLARWLVFFGVIWGLAGLVGPAVTVVVWAGLWLVGVLEDGPAGLVGCWGGPARVRGGCSGLFRLRRPIRWVLI